MSMTDNSREMIGGNSPPDYAKLETARLADEYRGFTNTLADLASEAEKAIPAGVADDSTALRVGGIIKRFRDLGARLENTRIVEVEPDLRRMNAKNAFFNGLKKLIQPAEKIERRTSPGWIDKLQAMIDAYQADKEAKERARLEREAAERRRIEQEARDKAEREAEVARKAAAEAAERQAAADRARTAETQAAKQKAADDAAAAAQEAESKAAESSRAVDAAAEQATDARIATLAKPADLVRTRGVTEDGAGVTLTSGKEPYAYVSDYAAVAVEAAKLFPYFNEKEIEKAVRAYAKASHHNQPLAGCEIGWKTKGITR